MRIKINTAAGAERYRGQKPARVNEPNMPSLLRLTKNIICSVANVASAIRRYDAEMAITS
jgi:hypothetical protein